MSNRTLVAGNSADHAVTDAEAQCWLLIASLFRLGAEHSAREVRIATNAALTARMESWQEIHVDHPQYERRCEVVEQRRQDVRDLIASRDHVDAEATILCRALAVQLGQIPARRLATLRKMPGWSRATSLTRVSLDLWREAKKRSPLPFGEAGF